MKAHNEYEKPNLCANADAQITKKSIDQINISFDFVFAALNKKKSSKYLPIIYNIIIKKIALKDV